MERRLVMAAMGGGALVLLTWRSFREDGLLWRWFHPWRRVGTLASIYIYPLKSGTGLSVQAAEAHIQTLTAGANSDRSFMVWDPTVKKRVSASDAPKLVTLVANVEGSCLTISASQDEELADLMINLDSVRKQRVVVEARVFSHMGTLETLDCGDRAGSWLSEALGQANLRLIFRPTFSDDLDNQHFIAGAAGPGLERLAARKGDFAAAESGRLHDPQPSLRRRAQLPSALGRTS